MSTRYDIAIVGTGPAGLSAAINAKIRNKNIIVFGNENFSNKLIKAPKIKNYLGFDNVSGIQLKNAFENHIKAMDIDINEEKINNVYAMGKYFSLQSKDNMYEAKKVIIATGMEFSKPMEGEEKFLGNGVGYCATCDAPLYKNKQVAIIGYNKAAEEEANYVSEIASKVYFIPMYKEKYNLKKDIEIILDKPIKIEGNLKAEKLILQECVLNVDGIFILKDSVPPNQLVPGLKMEEGHIKINRKMQTSIKGCYAAGDCTGKPYQYIKSAGEGQVAALNAVSELDNE